MTTAPRYRSRAWALALSLGTLLSGPLQADVLRLDFAAVLLNGTCTLSLDNSTLALDQVHISQLQPGVLINPRPFTLLVSECQGDMGGLKPVVKITGAGGSQDGKWLFRQPGSAKNLGVMVIKSDSVPGSGQAEVRDGSAFALAAAGTTPADQSLTFYAGISCGNGIGGRCNLPGSGEVTATLMFSFAYQ